MARLFLATALVVHLSGVSAVAAFVCTEPGMTAETCCCHHQRDGGSSGAPEAAAPCPCAMTPAPPAPVTQTPVTVSASRDLVSPPAILAVSVFDSAAHARREAVDHRAFADTSPPPSAISPLRC